MWFVEWLGQASAGVDPAETPYQNALARIEVQRGTGAVPFAVAGRAAVALGLLDLIIHPSVDRLGY